MVLNVFQCCEKATMQRRQRHLYSTAFAFAVAVSFVLLTPDVASGYSSGAPSDACATLLPGHGQEPQSSPAPYNISVSTRLVGQGEVMHLAIGQSNGGPPFKGFMVQVRSARTATALGSGPDRQQEVLGRFITNSHTLVDCGGRPNSSITHSESKNKESVKLYWLSPADWSGSVRFHVTVVHNFTTFWQDWQSDAIQVSAEAGDPEGGSLRNVPSTTPATGQNNPSDSPTDGSRSVTPTPPPQSTSQLAPANNDPIESVYDDCNLSKSCLAKDTKCVQERNCDLMFTHALNSARDGLAVELVARVPSDHYVAFALSSDDSMGDDAVIYCVFDNPAFSVRYAYNAGKLANARVTATSTSGGGGRELVSNVTGSHVDGVLLCRFSHTFSFKLLDREWRLDDDYSHILVASGATAATPERSPSYHQTRRFVSAKPVQLGKVGATTGGGGSGGDLAGLLFRVHGALMVAAWLGAASSGMLLARYYKHTWVGRQVCGVDRWFLGHRALMTLTVLTSLGAVGCAAWALGGWTTTPLFGGPGSSLHPLLGIVCVALACLQPLMAACRPHPGAPRRPVFNWLHWLVGSAAHALAVAAIFFAIELPQAQLPFWTYWVVVAFVSCHLLCHLVLSVQQYWADGRVHDVKQSHGMPPGLNASATPETYSLRDMRSMNNYGGAAASMAMPPGSGLVESRDAAGSLLRQTLLGIYLLAITVFVVLLVLIIVLAPLV